MSRLQRHALFWVAYVLFKTHLNVSDDPVLSFDEYMKIILAQVSFLLVKIPVVYLCFFAIDRYKTTRSIPIVLSIIGVGSMAMSMCNHFIVLPLLNMQSSIPVFAVASLLYHSFTLMFVTGVAISIRLFRRQHQFHLREALLKKEKTEAELKYLKGQLNPHFLFNTLNNIYSLAMKEGSHQTSEAILRLSKMMRFVLYEAGSSYIPLKDELALIQDYINLERLRYSNRLEIRYSENVDDPGQQIAPLLLIHFVENAFKHGASETRNESFVDIVVSLVNRQLEVTVVNSKGDDIVKSETSIGMENITKQLGILYPDHTLEITDTDQKYSVYLSIHFHNR